MGTNRHQSSNNGGSIKEKKWRKLEEEEDIGVCYCGVSDEDTGPTIQLFTTKYNDFVEEQWQMRNLQKIVGIESMEEEVDDHLEEIAQFETAVYVGLFADPEAVEVASED